MIGLTRHVTEYSPAKTGEYPRKFVNFQNCALCEKDLKNNKHLESHSFRRASLSEHCSLLGTDNVRGQISVHIFAPKGDYCLYIAFYHQDLAGCVGQQLREMFFYLIQVITRAVEAESRHLIAPFHYRLPLFSREQVDIRARHKLEYVFRAPPALP